MPLHLYPSVRASGKVPAHWKPSDNSPLKYPVRNAALHGYLQTLLPGTWKKVIKQGHLGEIHYFEHASGQVAGVKFLPDEPAR